MPTSLFNPALNFDFWVTMWEVQSPQLFGLEGSAVDEVAGVASALVGIGTTFLFGTFSKVSGLDAELDLEEYHEGGNNRSVLRFAKRGSHPELVLERGVSYDTSIADWYHQVKAGDMDRLRKDGLVLLMDRGGPDATGMGLPGLDRVPVAGWYFRRAIPKRIAGPTLNAKGNEVAIERLELAHEGLDRLSPALIPGMADFAAGLGGLGSSAIGAGLGGLNAAMT